MALSALQFIGFVILGLVVTTGAVLGAVALLARWVVQSVDHDVRTCSCVDCQRKRMKQWPLKKQIRQEYEQTAPQHNQALNLKKLSDNKSPYLSTAELQVHTVVFLHSGQWEVVNKLSIGQGTTVVLRHRGTGQLSSIYVPRREMHHKKWTPRPQDWTR